MSIWQNISRQNKFKLFTVFRATEIFNLNLSLFQNEIRRVFNREKKNKNNFPQNTLSPTLRSIRGEFGPSRAFTQWTIPVAKYEHTK